jgi:uncharacterized protein YhhL (DUF1145 family)
MGVMDRGLLVVLAELPQMERVAAGLGGATHMVVRLLGLGAAAVALVVVQGLVVLVAPHSRPSLILVAQAVWVVVPVHGVALREVMAAQAEDLEGALQAP